MHIIVIKLILLLVLCTHTLLLIVWYYDVPIFNILTLYALSRRAQSCLRIVVLLGLSDVLIHCEPYLRSLREGRAWKSTNVNNFFTHYTSCIHIMGLPLSLNIFIIDVLNKFLEIPICVLTINPCECIPWSILIVRIR